jgi:hypothetical protein
VIATLFLKVTVFVTRSEIILSLIKEMSPNNETAAGWVASVLSFCAIIVAIAGFVLSNKIVNKILKRKKRDDFKI